MSLINQMLQDLEKRGEDEGSHAAAHYAQFGEPDSRSKSRQMPWLLLLIFIAVAVAAFFFIFKSRESARSNLTPPEKSQALNKDVLAAANSESSVDASSVINSTTSPSLSELGLSLKLSTQVSLASLVSIASANVTDGDNEKLRPELAVTSDAESKPPKAATVQLGEVAPKLNKSAERKSESELALNPDRKAVLIKNTTSPPSASTVAAPVTMIKEVSMQQRAEGEYRQATVYQQQGRVNEALSALENALKADPLHAPARQLLISILLENKRHEDAIRELRRGLEVEPGQLNFSMILARLLVERVKLSEAIEVLQKNLSLAHERPDYLAFLAALQQKTGHHKEAIVLYRQALKNHSQNGAWWMGLGISLQAEVNYQEAIDAYKQAKLQAGLSAELHAFIDQKISQLQK
ncbi:MAG: tetratricopeptide repeat protein [Candidatus Aquirickettsiella gammari]